MKKFLFLAIIFIGIFFAYNVDAKTIYQCNKGYLNPYTNNFSQWYYYPEIATSSSGFYNTFTNCWDIQAGYTSGGAIYFFKGRLGNATIITGGDISDNECRDGTCDYFKTGNWSSNLQQGDTLFFALFDGRGTASNVLKFLDFFTGSNEYSGNYVLEAPNQYWSIFYFYYGIGEFTAGGIEYFGTTEEQNIISQWINAIGEVIENQPPISYFVDMYNAWNFGEIATDSSKSLDLDFSYIGLGISSISFNPVEEGFNLKNNFQTLFDIFCYLGTGIGVFYMIRNFVRPD
jgi:hypothetical protein